MKKHQLAAMVLSALSAGILISCSKPNDDTSTEAQSTTAEDANAQANTDSTSAADTNSMPKAQAIEIDNTQLKSYLDQVVNTQIIAPYQQVLQHSQALNQQATKACQANAGADAEQLEAMRQQWLALAKAWAQAEIVNFGPAMDSMSNLYINYYPDERGLVHQGVVDLIANKPNLTAEQLASESAIVQGVPGLEEVLYSNDSLTAAQCQYVMSASEALSVRLQQVVQDWQTSPDELLGVTESDSKQGLSRWINSVLSLVETTKSSSLDQPLGLTGNKKGHLPAQAAGQSREIITAKVSALNTALTDPELIAILEAGNQQPVADKLSTSLAQTSTLLAQLPENIAEASPEQQQDLYDKLTEITQIIKRQLMPTLGVQVGFNSTDGD
ncbi:imelysin family protein [Psychrobacter sp. FDAARGOS_221]|uniref:imelysin family protein n=1 Tax=Psychrobacter sp. FDAARGOS_221 TaxID=1975705 RepID=UPI000BB5980A|nr:imelysin family protein [Psychrobacter sp. FDAARGOS_221]PNK61007.1 peptidase M75 [Psychrobacter sp. FDAARGOS_221]